MQFTQDLPLILIGLTRESILHIRRDHWKLRDEIFEIEFNLSKSMESREHLLSVRTSEE